MAKTKSNALDRSPLINDNPADTLNYCAAVLEFVAGSRDDGAPTINYDFGRYLVLLSVSDALRYESSRVGVRHG